MICRKCNTTGTLSIRKVYTFCDNCFSSNINHKFRACIGKNTKLKKNEKVLICLSGGISSTVLLDLIIQGISLDTHKKLRIIPMFLHITGIESDDQLSGAIVNQCKGYDVDVHIKNIAEFNSFDHFDTEIFSIYQHLKKLTPTTRQDFLAKLKQWVFCKVAKELGCNIVFTAETITKLSEKLLSNIVMGQGPQIENDVGFCDSRNSDINIYRPMRDITKEELQHYSRIKHLNPVNSRINETCSLQSTISRFILNLEENTPATISTIYKTADKIGSEEDNKSNKLCSICKSTIDSKATKLTAADALAFSKSISSGHSLDGDLSYNSVLSPSVNDTLCYSCIKNYSELKSL